MERLLRPPRGGMPVGLGWVLRRAFGPVEVCCTPGDVAEAVRLARALDLQGRIGGRVPVRVLVAEVGEEAAAAFGARFRAGAAGMMVLQHVARELGEVGQEQGIPVVLLKGVALSFMGVVPLGLRGSCDVDVLVPAGEDRRFQQALVARGWRAEDLPGAEQHLAPVVSPRGLVVEVHHTLRGVRLIPEGGSASFQELDASGLLLQMEAVPEGCLVPDLHVVVAHLLVHGLGQHLWAPASYPLLRLIADLSDLRWGREAWERFMAGCFRWIEADVPRGLVDAARDLADRLARGEAPEALWEGAGGAGLLLRHMVLGALDHEYRKALRMKAVVGALPAGRSRVRTLSRTVLHTVWLTRAQVDIIYGKPRSAAGYWGRRLWRPFDLVARTLRYALAWLRHRARTR